MSEQAEREVISMSFVAGFYFQKAMKGLTPEMFRNPNIRKLFELMLDMYQRGVPIETKPLLDEIKDNSVLYGQLINCLAGSGQYSMESAIRNVTNDYMLVNARNVINHCRTKLSKYTGDPLELISSTIDELTKIKVTVDRNAQSFENIYDGMIVDFMSGKSAGLQTHMSDELDKALGGFFPGDLVVVAGRTSMGKTDFGINVVVNNAVRGKRVLIISLEMTQRAIVHRISALFTTIFRGKYRRGSQDEIDHKRLWKSRDQVVKLPIKILADKRMSVIDIQVAIQECQNTVGCDLVMVDYMGLIKPVKGRTREQEVAAISAELKDATKSMNIPMIAISQLNRQAEYSDSKRPKLADLRDSGAIEQDADIVLLLYRPSYYDKSKEDSLDVDIAKDRYGDTVLIEGISYERGTGRIGDWRHTAEGQENPESDRREEAKDDTPF